MAGEDVTYSVDDIIQGELEVEQEVNVILGATSDQECTYKQGYLYRQPIFVCLTCSPNDTADGEYPGGICLACSLKCHSSHKVEELYTKRNFRCDCGNRDKYGHLQDGNCQLGPCKADCNEGNVYGANFYGLYCICKKVFDGEEEMIQCVLCEDWFHLEHCGLVTTEGIGELACPTCMEANQFLFVYTEKAKMEECVVKIVEKLSEKEVEILEEKQEISEEITSKTEDSCANNISETLSEANSLKRKLESPETNPKRLKTETETETESESVCLLKILTNPYQQLDGLPGVFSDEWRESLCRCKDCKDLYKTRKIEFLLKANDTISYYENQAKCTDSFSNGEGAFSEMISPMQRTELLYQFNNLKEEFTDFFRPFAAEGKTVRKEDIQEFFEELTRKKERTNDAGIPPENCKL